MSELRGGEAIAELGRALGDPGGAELPRSVLRLRVAAEEEPAVKRSLSSLLRGATVLKRFSHADTFRFKDVDRLYAEAVGAECPDYLIEALNYLRLHGAIAARLRSLPLPDELWFDAPTPRRAAPALIEAVEEVGGFEAELLSSRLVLGKLHALRSRAEASPRFAEAGIRLRADGELLAYEGGAGTYFDRATLERRAGAIAERRASLPLRQEYGPIDPGGARHLCLVSCERTFLRVYLPYWLGVAEFLHRQGFAYHVLLVAPPDEAAAAVEDAEALALAMAKLRGADPAILGRVVSFSSVALPPDCADERSYSACVRYLYAREVCERAGTRVIVQDIDLVVSHDPTAWFDAMSREKIVLGSYSPDVSLDPWRKFSPGVFGLPHDESAFELMRVVEDYILEGLVAEGSWYLDQNALAYLHDAVTGEGASSPDSLFSLDDQRVGMPAVPGGLRPIRGLPVHGMFERHARAAQGSAGAG